MENANALGGESVLPQRAIVVGRDPELRALDELADRAVEDRAQVVFVSGEAGIGKSTLVSHFLAGLTASGWGVHVGQCIEFSERAIPFGPVIGLVRSVLDNAGDGADEILGHHRADLSALLPEWRTEGIDGAPLSGDVDRLIDAISTVLKRAVDARPMALFIEDIHWADGPTRDVVASLIHRLGTSRTLVVVSERTGAVPRGHVLRTWLAEQRRFPNVHTLTLEGLSTEALTEQAENILGERPDASMVADLEARTGGNAYFASELLLARAAGGHALPATLADFLTSRIEQLDADEQEVLRAIAVAGNAISHRILDAALPELDVGPPVRTLFDVGMISVENGNYDFGHALMRESMLRGVLPFEAEELHRRIAQAMVDASSQGKTPAELARIAMHWTAANDTTQSLVASIEASEASANVAAYELAAELAIDALRTWPAVVDAESLTQTTRDRLTVDASDWLVASNQSSAADELLADTLSSWGSELPNGRRALLLAKLAPLRFLSGRPEEATSLLDEAIALVGDEVSPEAAQIHHRACKLALLNAAIVPAMTAADRAIEIASDVGPETILVDAMASKALGLGVTVSMEAGIELVHEARRRALAKNLVSQAAYTFRVEMMIIYFRVGPTQKSGDVLRDGVEFANRRCGPNIRVDLAHDLALCLVEAGKLNDAAPLLVDLLADQHGQTLRAVAIQQTRALAALLVGDLDEAERALAVNQPTVQRFSSQEIGFHHRLEAELARRRGKLDESLRLVDAAIELQVQSDNMTFLRESLLEKCRLVRTIASTDLARAQAIRPDLDKLIDDSGGEDQMPASLVGLMRLELTLVDGTARASEVDRLASELEESGFGADAIQTALIHAQLLAEEQPDSVELAQAITELRALVASSGMRWIGDAVDAIAPDAPTIDLTDVVDVTEPVDTPEIPDHGLTPREVEVLGYLARGLTNKEIGTELYVSHRTVSTHVSNLLSKLHLKNRSEAASKFHELGFARATL